MQPAIRVENVSKKFRIGCNATDGGYGMFRDVLGDTLAAPWRRFRKSATASSAHDFWALKSMNFEVQPGEAIGFLGRNGAGKSTLLKVLSQITPPTTGRIELRGRVGSLLEVGTGFHLE